MAPEQERRTTLTTGELRGHDPSAGDLPGVWQTRLIPV